jgi:hypothetical protein
VITGNLVRLAAVLLVGFFGLPPAQGQTCIEAGPVDLPDAKGCQVEVFIPPAQSAETSYLSPVGTLRVNRINISAICNSSTLVTVLPAYLAGIEGVCEGLKVSVVGASQDDSNCSLDQFGALTVNASQERIRDGSPFFERKCLVDLVFEMTSEIGIEPPETGKMILDGSIVLLDQDGAHTLVRQKLPINVRKSKLGVDSPESIFLDGRKLIVWTLDTEEMEAFGKCETELQVFKKSILPKACDPEELLLKESKAFASEADDEPGLEVELTPTELSQACQGLTDSPAQYVEVEIYHVGCNGWLETTPVIVQIPVKQEFQWWILLVVLAVACGVVLIVLLKPPNRAGLYVKVGDFRETIFRRNDQRRATIPLGQLVSGEEGELCFQLGERQTLLAWNESGGRVYSPSGELKEPTPVLALQKGSPGLRKLRTLYVGDDIELVFGFPKTRR